MIYLLDDVCASDTMQNVMSLVKLIMNVICIVVPIILIVLGSLDLFKAVTAGKEEDIKKKQKALITRLIAGVLVFLVPTIVKVLMSLIGSDAWEECWDSAGNYKLLFEDYSQSEEEK